MLGSADLRRMAGLYTIFEVADQLGVKRSTFYDQLCSGRLPRPATQVKQGRRCYYTRRDVSELRERMKEPE